jgi:lambda family phage portal protein
MKVIDRIKFKIGRWALGGFSRGYSELAKFSGQMSDWITSGISDDADLQANWFKLVQRSRDLFKLNPYMRRFRLDLIANVYGSEGITLQMKIKEDVDRVVYVTDPIGKDDPRQLAEKAWLAARQRSRDEFVRRAGEHGLKLPHREYLSLTTSGNNGSTRIKATVKAGQPDPYANSLIEKAWKRWQKRENCTIGRRHTYSQTREQRLTMCARDGDVFIRHIRGAPNDFGYAIQLIAAEWVDHGLNQILNSGSYIKMGIEYDQFGVAVAYHIIKRRPGDWLSTQVATSGRWSPGVSHERVEAREIIHYCQFDDSESGRGAPWIASVMGKLRHLDKYSEAEVISARAEACKGGHYEATIGGMDATELADRIEDGSNELTTTVEPAMWKPLPFGWTAKPHDPRHPSGNFPAFKKECLREIATGCGDFYNTFANDMEGVNYSSMRGGFLDVRELWMLTQRFDIETAEIPIFEAWLEMALMKGAIPLPVSKLEKFNQPSFQGRRWPWVDPMKDAKADQLSIQTFLTSRTRICNENGDDFEEIIEEQALEKILIEEAGLKIDTTPPSSDNQTDDPNDDPAAPNKSRLVRT